MSKIEEVTKIVREASMLMKRKDVEVIQKGDYTNYVTSIDIAVQKALTEKLTALIPGSEVLGEESDAPSVNTESLWIIDPIDGTSDFIRGIGLSAISVGYMKDGELNMGVVYQPDRDEMFYAVKGEGAFLNGRPIHVSDRDYRHSHLCSAMSLYKKEYAKPCFNIIEKIYMETEDMRRLGTASLEMAYLAAGRVELYFEIRLFPWDVAAAVLLIQEAGGYVKFLKDEGLPLTKPFPICAANTRSSLDRIEKIIMAELPETID